MGPQVWQFEANSGEVQIFNQPIGAQDWSFRLSGKEVSQDGDNLEGDMQILIVEIDMENENTPVHAKEGAETDDERAEDKSGMRTK